MAEPGGAVAVPAPAAHPGPHPNGRAPGRYYLLPYAGGGHAAYRLLTDHWAARPDRHPAAVPFAWDSARYLGGSGLRGLAGELARRIADDLAARPVDRYGLFGHSMGALLAYETAAALLELDCPPPAVLAVSGRVAPQYGFRPAVDLDDPRSTAEYLRSCGGALAQAAEDPEFVELVQERLRGDVLLGAEHVHQERPPLPLPVIALGGRDDPLAAHEEMAGWLRHGVGTGELRLFPGGHWFLWDHVPAVAARLAEALRTGAVTAEGGETTERPAECRNTFPGSNTA
ncbi:thioesterase II family protein [Streptomyces yokosukanensis]|uniref:thioesterase II family protein n=1 Tax=Streptomyces yokosukanensis TaxID=67386 RepID=UPI00082C56AB|nr:thioesterase domain-containing protein [Streptomyces yokosukanensis]